MELRRTLPEVGASRSVLGPAPLRSGLIGVAVGLAAIAPAAFAPDLLAHSTYLLGVAALLITAGWGGPVAVILCAFTALSGALVLDQRAGIPTAEVLIRAGLFLALSTAAALRTATLERQRRKSADNLERLERQEAMLRSILDTAPDALIVIDSSANISSFSPAAETLFGWTREEVIGRNVNMLMPGSYHAEHDGYMERYLATGEKRIIGKRREVTGMRKDGSRFPMVLHVGEIKLGDERHFTGFVHDLTSLTAAHDRSEQLRTQLTHVWRMNSLGEMAAMLAHELNQPLTAISNYVRGARGFVSRMEGDNDELLDALEIAGAQAIRAGDIIRRTRSLVAREETAHQLHSLGELIAETQLMMELIAREADVTLRYELMPAADLVRVDRIQIQQVIGNLVRNAVDALRDRPKRILVVSTQRAGPKWIVRVEDSGPGVPEELRDQLFEPMTTTKPGGMGLGLSICKTILDRHEGEVWVGWSRLGGAAFCFSLPVEEAG